MRTFTTNKVNGTGPKKPEISFIPIEDSTLAPLPPPQNGNCHILIIVIVRLMDGQTHRQKRYVRTHIHLLHLPCDDPPPLLLLYGWWPIRHMLIHTDTLHVEKALQSEYEIRIEKF